MNRKVWIITVAALFVFSAAAVANVAAYVTSSETSVTEILLNPAKYDRMQVKVEGEAIQVHSVPSPFGGPPLTGFFLVDGKTGARIGVVYVKRAWDVKDSSKVTVQGIYYKARGQTGNTNVIEAIFVQ
jgi:hypothetical protein